MCVLRLCTECRKRTSCGYEMFSLFLLDPLKRQFQPMKNPAFCSLSNVRFLLSCFCGSKVLPVLIPSSLIHIKNGKILVLDEVGTTTQSKPGCLRRWALIGSLPYHWLKSQLFPGSTICSLRLHLRRHHHFSTRSSRPDSFLIFASSCRAT